jgi:hypothetical protein
MSKNAHFSKNAALSCTTRPESIPIHHFFNPFIILEVLAKSSFPTLLCGGTENRWFTGGFAVTLRLLVNHLNVPRKYDD